MSNNHLQKRILRKVFRHGSGEKLISEEVIFEPYRRYRRRWRRERKDDEVWRLFDCFQ